MKKAFSLLVIILIFSHVFAQVSPQTGSAGYSLPMFSWKDAKSRLNGGVSLDYNSGNGLKVNDVASNVGQGWNLAAGGIITRMQVGEPDDQRAYKQGSSEQYDDLTKYPAGYLYAGLDIALGVSNSLAYYPLFGAKNILYKQFNEVAADKELDRFAFQFNGRSGIFILDKATNTGVMLGDSKIKISFVIDDGMISQQIRTNIDKFLITDENGIQYTFSIHGTAKVLRTKYSSQDFAYPLTQPTFKSGKRYYENSFEDASIVNPYVINNWYLSQAEDLLTHRKITFNYTSRNITANAGLAISYFSEKNYSVLTNSVSKNTNQELSSIAYPDGYQVNFNYDALKPRIDLPGDMPLASVDVTYSGRNVSRHELKTSYFILNRYGNPTSVYQRSVARLCLQSVKKTGPDLKADEPPTLFDYYLGSSIADDVIPSPFTPIKDIWGFYNGDFSKDASNNNSFNLATKISALDNIQLKGLCFLRDVAAPSLLIAKAGYAKNGLLKQVTYPTGGAMFFEYAQNVALLQGQTTNVGGVHVSKTSVTDAGYSNDCSHKIETNYSYNLTGSTQSSLWGVTMPVNSLAVSSYYSPQSKHLHYKFPLGISCKYKYNYPGILSQDQAIDLTGHQKFMQTLFSVLDVVSGALQVFDIITVCISATPGAIFAIILDVISTIVTLVLTCLVDQSKNSISTIYYNSDINGANPLPSQFKRVEISESSGGNGKTVMEFTNTDDYPLWEPTNPSFSMVQRFAPWAYGLPKKTTLYDVAGNKVKETENIYDISKAKRSYGVWIFSKLYPPVYKPGYQSCKYLITANSSMRSDYWSDPNTHIYSGSYIDSSNSNLIIKMYEVFGGSMPLLQSTERVYKQSNPTQYSETKTNYFYDDKNYQVNSISRKESNGITGYKYFKYSCDFGSMVLNNLTQSNIINEPVLVTSAISTISSVIAYTGEVATEYTALANGNIVPYRKLERRLSAPIDNSTNYTLWTYYNGQASTTDNPLFKETQVITYDALGNLVGLKDEGNRTVTNIYDYNDKYVVASVINAVPVIDKSAYTSFETAGLGGWALSGTANYSTNAVTGARSLSIDASNSLTATLNTAKGYKLSFWAASVLSVSAGASLVRSAPLINGFTYYEYNITPGTLNISVTGVSTLDELRLYPQTSRMRTVTYDPVIGKTSECDENNRVTYYEYDDLGRLRFIKDDNRNTLKMYEYNIAKKPVCPGSYQNLAVSEIFTRNNCSAGTTGVSIVYTIAAGTYTSSFSQAIVDQQVQNDLLLNGQNYANTNSTCIPLYNNVAKSQDFSKEDCPIGYAGSTITYSVPANKYSSTINQADADQQAQDEIDANGQSFANVTGNTVCVISYDPDWIDTGLQQCQNGHKLIQFIDQNPNSTSYNTTQWIDNGADASCPAPCSNCSAEGFRCTSGVCEQGFRINTASDIYKCTYHYEYSDGFSSQDYYDYSGNPCAIQ